LTPEEVGSLHMRSRIDPGGGRLAAHRRRP
jgi:hypothetical protein